MPIPEKNILIVANSGRMLAQLSRNAGLVPLVIDCFSDCDTQYLALDCVKVNTLELKYVRKALSVLSHHNRIRYVVYGSGLELYNSTIKFLFQNLVVLGNTQDVFSLIQNKTYFFSRLKYLGILFPDITFQAPEINDNWLVKPKQGEGGLGIKKYERLSKITTSCYWQKFITGKAMSVLFVANGNEYKIIGFNKQYFTRIEDNQFVFSGVISQPEINKDIIQTINLWLAALIPDFALKGVNTLDFIVKNNCCYVLEVNARPSASMQLYQQDLLTRHINSFIDAQLQSVIVIKTYKAYKVVFAEAEVFINDHIQWPQWVVDIPKSGSIIHTGMPICSIIADGKNEPQINNLLLNRQQYLKKLLQ